MCSKKLNSFDELYKYYQENMGNQYNSKSLGELWGGPNYPKPFVCFNRQANADTITHFVDGIGDLNPLCRDEEYAKKTKYGCLIAPPCFLYSVLWAGTAVDLRHGIHGWFSGSEWEWFKPIIENDVFEWKTVQPSEVQVKESAMAKRTMIVYNDDEFKNQKGEVVARHRGWAIHGERDVAIARKKNASVAQIQKYTKKNIEKIQAAQRQEVIRGAKKRYWDDVTVGDQLTPVVFGPLTMNEMIVWIMGGGNLMNKSDRIWRILYEQHPDASLGLPDPDLNINMNLELPHFDNDIAKKVGIPMAYDFGSQRISWLGMLLTNWMGDDGFLWKMRAELRGFNLIGDTTWLKGVVERKYEDKGKFCVDIKCWGENQRGVVTMPGSATIILPSRKHVEIVYPKPGDTDKTHYNASK